MSTVVSVESVRGGDLRTRGLSASLGSIPRHGRMPCMSHGPPRRKGHRAAADRGGVCGRGPLYLFFISQRMHQKR